MADVKPLLQARAFDLAKLLLPGGRLEGDRWQGHDPNGGRDNFTIWIKGPAAGCFKAWASGGKGDVYGLLVHLGQAHDNAAALKWAKGWLGLEDAPEARVREIQAQAAVVDEAREAELTAKAARKARYAKAVWLGSSLVTKGDPVWTYLEAARGIPLPWLWRRRPVSALRAHPALDYSWPEAKSLDDYWAARRPKSGKSQHPAMVAMMTPVNGGSGAGLHRTYLTRTGDGKAEVPGAKKMHGTISGYAIKLWRGESGLSEGEAIKRGAGGTLVVTEGIEDALSVAAAAPEHRVWAVGSLSLLAVMPWPKCAGELVIAADNDWDKPEALKLLDKAATGLAAFGPVRIARAPAGQGLKDMNDLLNAARRQT
jgi:nucleotide-binding universal stress UspA family protein